MTAPAISFIIPVLNEAGRIGALLEDLAQRYPDAERVVIDGGSVDDTVRRALPHCHQLLLGAPGRAAQMNLGAEVASGDYLFFLHADTVPQISAAALDAVLTAEPMWGFSPVRLSGSRLAFAVIGWFMNQRTRLTKVATGDQMLFARRTFFSQHGGYDDIALMEDVALCKRLRRVAAPVVLPEAVITSSRRWEDGGVVRTVLRMWALRAAYVCGASPSTLWRYYYGK